MRSVRASTAVIGEVIGKYFDRGFSGQRSRQIGVALHGRLHDPAGFRHSLQATGEAQDPTLAFEAAADRLENRLRRYKRRLKSHNSATPMANPPTSPIR